MWERTNSEAISVCDRNVSLMIMCPSVIVIMIIIIIISQRCFKSKTIDEAKFKESFFYLKQSDILLTAQCCRSGTFLSCSQGP